MPAAWATTVRTDAITRLAAAGTIASTRVRDSMTRGIQADTQDGSVTADVTPMLVVETGGVQRELRSHSKNDFVEILDLVVQGYVVPTDGESDAALAARLDTLEEQAFVALWQDGDWLVQYRQGSGAGEGLEPRPTDKAVYKDESGIRLGRFRQVHEIKRRVVRPAYTGGDALERVVATITTDDATIATVDLQDLEA